METVREQEEEILTVRNPGRNEVLIKNACGSVASTDSARDVGEFALIAFHHRLRLGLHEVHVLAVSQRVLNHSTDIRSY